MKFIDTHCHLDMEEFSKDCDNVVKKAKENGVEKIITIGCNLNSAYRALEISKKHENIFVAIGIHPNEITKKNYEGLLNELEEIEKLAKEKKVVAIGEIGLDYRGLEKDEDKEKQKEFFLRQFSIAQRLKKPVIIHCREAYENLIDILKAKSYQLETIYGVVHCFSGRLSQAKKILDLGFFVSFTGIITYSRSYDNVIKEISLERLLIETDAPFLAPLPYRGQRNEPAYVVEIAKKIAEIKKISLVEVAEKTSQNANLLFGL